MFTENINYSDYDFDTEAITVTIDSGTKMKIYVEDREIEMHEYCYSFNHDDEMFDIYVMYDKKLMPLNAFKEWAISEFDTIRAIEQEAADDEDAMRRELESPYWTGRI